MLVGGSVKGIVPKQDDERSINFFPIAPESANARPALRGRPGLSLLTTLPKTPIRGVVSVGDRPFMVAGGSIYELTVSGYTEWGTIPSQYGDVTLASLTAGNNTTIIIGDGAGYHALDLTTRTVSAVTSAPRGRFCVYHKNRILYEGENGQVYYSELLDPTNIPELNLYTAESLPDDIVALVSTENEIYHFGSESVEIFYNSGDSDNPFEPIPSGVSFNGCAFPNTALRLDNSVYWVGKDEQGAGVVYRMNGTVGARVSTSSVERAIEAATTVSAHSYQEEGNTFYRVNTDRATWVFNLATQLWHEEAWLNPATGDQERARPEHHVYALGGHLVTDYASGRVYRQSLDYHDDAGQEIRRTRIDSFHANGRQIIFDELFADFVTGVGQATDRAPQVMLEVAPDGASYGRELMRPLGAIGEYKNRVRFHRLGKGTDFKIRLSVSDPVPVILRGGDIRARMGNR
ncbi:packaged DNA stabilization protein [Sphingomicrobium sp. XHP0235]|uniref:packaged DNA stabilization protein n=1 Tax=Sphingomicrobium aquimarinum TaxID=3133971 RepID=UPI0031FEB73F